MPVLIFSQVATGLQPDLQRCSAFAAGLQPNLQSGSTFAAGLLPDLKPDLQRNLTPPLLTCWVVPASYPASWFPSRPTLPLTSPLNGLLLPLFCPFLSFSSKDSWPHFLALQFLAFPGLFVQFLYPLPLMFCVLPSGPLSLFLLTPTPTA